MQLYILVSYPHHTNTNASADGDNTMILPHKAVAYTNIYYDYQSYLLLTLSLELTSAPLSRSNFVISVRPRSAALKSAVAPS